MNEISKAAAILGRKGGQAGTGASKARPLTASTAARIRWGTFEQRFWSKVNKNVPDAKLNCWKWIGARPGGRYGCIYFRKRQWPAHRVSWVLHNGEIPEGLDVLHKCDNPPCVNPNHLFLGTHKENLQDASKKGKFSNRKGAGNKHSKVSDADVKQIRDLHASMTLTQRQIADKFNLTQGHVSAIVRGASWSHI